MSDYIEHNDLILRTLNMKLATKNYYNKCVQALTRIVLSVLKVCLLLLITALIYFKTNS